MSFETDIIVAGTGLAAYAAAIAAAERSPRLSVTLVGRPGPIPPSGPLRLLAPTEEAAREWCLSALSELSAPGAFEPPLAALMVDESHVAADFLAASGVPLPPRSRLRLGGDYIPLCRSILDAGPMAEVKARLRARAIASGVDIHEGLRLVTIGADEGPPGSAICTDLHDETVRLRARAVVLAERGCAPLFVPDAEQDVAAGLGLGLLRQTRAVLGNAAFIQMVWRTVDGVPFDLGRVCGSSSFEVAGQGGVFSRLPRPLAALASERAMHKAHAWSRADNAIDVYLLDCMTPAGVVNIRHERQPLRIAPAVVSATGGARITSDGATNLSGLYACGGCATGMFGADVLEGCHATAALVFGIRAGIGATRHACAALMPPPPEHHPPLPPRRLPLRLREALLQHCLPGHRPGLSALIERLRALASLPSLTPLEHCRVLSALTVAEFRSALSH